MESRKRKNPEAPSNEKKSRRNREYDPPYSKKNYPKKRKKGDIEESIWNFYGDHSVSYTDETGKIQAVYTSVLVNTKNLVNNFQTLIDKEFFISWLSATLQNNYKEIPTYSKAVEIVETTELGTPTKIKTKDKEGKEVLLSLKEKSSPYHFFDNIPTHIDYKNKKIVETIDPHGPFFKSDTYKNLKKNLEGFKKGKITITPELLKKTKTEREVNTLISQNKAMVNLGVDAKHGSAKEYVKSTGLFSTSDIKKEEDDISTFKIHIPSWHWGHGIPKFVLGALGQNPEYLAIITEFANQLMFFTEADIQSLSKKYPDGFDFEFTYHLIKGTHIAHSFESKIITKDFIYAVKLNPQTENKPHIAFRYYMNKNLNAITEFAQNQGKIMQEFKKDKYEGTPARKLQPKTLKFGPLFNKTPPKEMKTDNIKFRLRKKS